MTRRWTPWAVIVEASKYETRSQFRKADSYAYTMAVKLDLLNSLFPRTNTLASAITLAIEVNDSAQLRNLYPAAARMLHRYGYTNLGVKREQYDRGSSLEETIALAIEVNDSAQLRKRYPAAARMLHRNGYYTTGVKHGKLFPENPEEEKYLSRGNSC